MPPQSDQNGRIPDTRYRYSSNSMAILLGMFTSFSVLMAIDGPTHLAEEIPRPKVALPRIMLIVVLSQSVVGIVWVIVLGFSITDLDAINQTATRYCLPSSVMTLILANLSS